MGAAELIRTGFGFLVKWMEHAVYRVVLCGFLGNGGGVSVGMGARGVLSMQGFHGVGGALLLKPGRADCRSRGWSPV